MARSKTPSPRASRAKGGGLPAVEVAVKPTAARPGVVARARLEAVEATAAPRTAAVAAAKPPVAKKAPVVPKRVPPKAKGAPAKEPAGQVEAAVPREPAVVSPLEEAREPAPVQAAPAPASAQPTYALQVGQGFSLLTQLVEGGAVVVSPPVPAGAWLHVSWWKESRQPSRPEVQVTSVRLHTLLDGTDHATRELGKVDAAGRLVRAGATVELPVGAKRLEYWFELTTGDGETLWDSNLSRNYALELGRVR